MLKYLLNMALSLTGPLNQLDIHRIVHDFDRDYFKTDKPLPVDRIIGIIQFQKKMCVHFPIELVNEIMRHCLEDCPSVGALLMYYKNSRVIVLHPLPPSDNIVYLNDASRSILVRLKQTPTNGELASYQQLMTTVFKYHFKKLTIDQKLELIRRSNITPWEQKSTSEKLELLGRIQAPTLWGQTKVRLQFLSWKVQFATAWALENNVIFFAVACTALVLVLSSFLLLIAGCFSSVASTAIYQTLNNARMKAFMYVIISAFGALGASLAMAGLGLVLQIPTLPNSIQEKGAWIQSVNWNSFLIAFHFILIIFQKSNETSHANLLGATQELKRLLLQSINEANLTVEQTTFVNTQLPDLMNKWLQLTNPSDTSTGSSQTQR